MTIRALGKLISGNATKIEGRASLGHSLLVCLCLFVCWTSIRAVDFGEHYDESHPILEPIQLAAQTGVLLPRNYQYPSFCFDLGLVGLIPDLLKTYLFHSQPRDPSVYLSQVLGDSAYILRMRSIVILLSLISMICLYVAIYRWRRNWVEALLASAIYGLSWETAYHSRFFTADSPMTQFGSLVIMFLIFAVTTERPSRYLQFAAIGAGLATGCKYPAALFIFPVLIAAFQVRNRLMQSVEMVFAKLCILFVVAYLCTTPGTVLDPIEFWRWVIWQWNIYAGGHGGFTVAAGPHHLYLMICYFALALFSRFSPIAVFFFLFSLFGAYSLMTRDRDKAFLILTFPVLYLYLFSMQQVMIVRNLIVLAPLFALCAARGLVDAYDRLRFPALKWSMPILVIMALFSNGAWLLYASETIRNRQSDDYIAELSEYLSQHPSQSFSLSPNVRDTLIFREGSIPPNATADPADKSAFFVFFDTDIPKEVYEHWRPNHFDFVYKCFGPLNINLNYYDPYLVQDTRIIILRGQDAAAIGVLPSARTDSSNGAGPNPPVANVPAAKGAAPPAGSNLNARGTGG